MNLLLFVDFHFYFILLSEFINYFLICYKKMHQNIINLILIKGYIFFNGIYKVLFSYFFYDLFHIFLM
jgi:hypothetical protein